MRNLLKIIPSVRYNVKFVFKTTFVVNEQLIWAHFEKRKLLKPNKRKHSSLSEKASQSVPINEIPPKYT